MLGKERSSIHVYGETKQVEKWLDLWNNKWIDLWNYQEKEKDLKLPSWISEIFFFILYGNNLIISKLFD